MSIHAPGFLFEQAGELLTAVLIEHPDGATTLELLPSEVAQLVLDVRVSRR